MLHRSNAESPLWKNRPSPGTVPGQSRHPARRGDLAGGSIRGCPGAASKPQGLARVVAKQSRNACCGLGCKRSSATTFPHPLYRVSAQKRTGRFPPRAVIFLLDRPQQDAATLRVTAAMLGQAHQGAQRHGSSVTAGGSCSPGSPRRHGGSQRRKGRSKQSPASAPQADRQAAGDPPGLDGVQVRDAGRICARRPRSQHRRGVPPP